MNEFDLPQHDNGISLSHNPHKGSDETIEQYISAMDEGEVFDWISDEERILAIQSNDMWVLDWFQDIQHTFVANSLNALLKYANSL